MRRKGNKLGFTLTELSIAIVFISILLLTIAVVTLNMIHSYHKGMAMKSINSSGLALIDEFTSAFADSPTLNVETLCKSLGDIGTKGDHAKSNTDTAQVYGWGKDYHNDTEGAKCMNDGAMEFVYQQFEANIDLKRGNNIIKGPNASPASDNYLPVAGVFCTGKYSYVWNTGYVLAQYDNNHSMTSYFYSNPDDPDVPMATLDNGFRLRKYNDTGHKLCSNNFPKDPADHSTTLYPDYSDDNHKPSQSNISATLNGFQDADKISLELISSSDIALYSVTIDRPIRNAQTGRVLYSGSFVLGSITGDIDISNPDYSSCNLEGTSTFDTEYCATNKFNFAIRAMGGNSGS